MSECRSEQLWFWFVIVGDIKTQKFKIKWYLSPIPKNKLLFVEDQGLKVRGKDYCHCVFDLLRVSINGHHVFFAVICVTWTFSWLYGQFCVLQSRIIPYCSVIYQKYNVMGLLITFEFQQLCILQVYFVVFLRLIRQFFPFLPKSRRFFRAWR